MDALNSPQGAGEGGARPGRAGTQEQDLGQAAAVLRAASSEEALVEAARALDTEAWATIYERHYRQVYAYAYHRVGDRHTAEDLAAEAFARALAAIRTYRYRGRPLLAWLYRIAHNLTADHLRRKARAPGSTPIESDVAAAPDVDLESVPTRQDLIGAIRSLSTEQQQVVILRFVQGFSSEEVASLLGKSSGAVRAIQCRAMTSLRRRLTAGGDKTKRQG